MPRGNLANFFHHFFKGLGNMFRKIPIDLKRAIHVGVVIVDKIKSFVDSPVVDVLTAIIPGDLDDKVKEKLREFLPKILIEMKLADKCGDLTNPAEITLCAIQTLQQIKDDWISADAKKNFFDSIAVLIAQVAADGKLTFDDAKYMVKWYYDNKYKKAIAK